MVLLSATALLGFIAGATFIASKQCIYNPTFCSSVNGNYYYWNYGPRISVTTGSGVVRGVTWKSRSGRAFHAFLGIPYGEVPSRFEVSRPYPRWNGVKDASTHGPMCTQIDRKKGIITGSEDCLHVNVFTPNINDKALLPVMVWIDASMGWETGCGDKINPKNFMDENAILVTFKFRLGPFGFLSTGDGEVQGNMGLKDQVLALNWVKQNIPAFGGDAGKITIFGADGGAASVHFHMLSPMSKGLFQHAISQGGSAHSPWALQSKAADKAKNLATHLNCDFSTTRRMMDCMKFKTPREILQGVEDMKERNWVGEPYALFAPTVEKKVLKSTAFLSDRPKDIIASGQFMKVPWIVGYNEEDGRYFAAKIINSPSFLQKANSDWTTIAPKSFFFDDHANKKEISSQIRSFYFGSHPISRETWENYTNLYTDRWTLSGIAESIRAHSTDGKVFPYVLRFGGDLRQFTPIVDGDYRFKRGPSHFDDSLYLFNYEWNSDPPMQWFQDFSRRLVNLWVSFADTGTPRGWGTTPDWHPMNPSSPKIPWYVIDFDTRVIDGEDLYGSRVGFWTKLNLTNDGNL